MSINISSKKQEFKAQELVAHCSFEDTLNIVRVSILCADIMVDFNEIENLIEDKKAKYFKQKYKQDIVEFVKFAEAVSNPFLRKFVVTNDVLVMKLQKSFTDISEKIFFINREITSMQLITAKAIALHNVLSQMSYQNNDLIKLKNLSHKAVTTYQKQYSSFYLIQDEFGNGMPEIANAMYTLSNKILFEEINKIPKNDQ